MIGCRRTLFRTPGQLIGSINCTFSNPSDTSARGSLTSVKIVGKFAQLYIFLSVRYRLSNGLFSLSFPPFSGCAHRQPHPSAIKEADFAGHRGAVHSDPPVLLRPISPRRLHL